MGQIKPVGERTYAERNSKMRDLLGTGPKDCGRPHPQPYCTCRACAHAIKVKFTPGPWRFDGAEVHANAERIVEFYSITGIPSERIEANGNLIASAPLLYEELEAAHFTLADLLALTNNADVRARIEGRMKAIREALAKAAS